MPRTVEFTVESGDIRLYQADVVALKYAQKFYGADQAVASQLERVKIAIEELQPPIGKYRFLETNNGITAPHVLYIGVPTLRQFRYQQIRQFSVDVLEILAHEAPTTRHVAMTIHGPGYGLDESEACSQQFAGCVQALLTGNIPAALERISFVELNSDRVTRFRATLEEELTKAGYPKPTAGWKYALKAATPNRRSAEAEKEAAPAPAMERSIEAPQTESEPALAGLSAPTVQAEPGAKPHAFIAMPFADDWDDVFYYGIQTPVHSAGLLCERVDKSAFTGDIMGYVRQRIETSSVVIAEISNANPNVYLEVGYAWGKDRPTILVVQHDKELHFDVQGQKCLTYKKIKDLEQALNRELKGMIDKGIIKAG